MALGRNSFPWLSVVQLSGTKSSTEGAAVSDQRHTELM